jgi:hypothetical protein
MPETLPLSGPIVLTTRQPGTEAVTAEATVAAVQATVVSSAVAAASVSPRRR